MDNGPYWESNAWRKPIAYCAAMFRFTRLPPHLVKFWWTYRPTKLLHFFPWDLQHAPSSESTQIHYLLVQPSAPQAGRQKQKHHPSANDLSLHSWDLAMFEGETRVGSCRGVVFHVGLAITSILGLLGEWLWFGPSKSPVSIRTCCCHLHLPGGWGYPVASWKAGCKRSSEQRAFFLRWKNLNERGNSTLTCVSILPVAQKPGRLPVLVCNIIQYARVSQAAAWKHLDDVKSMLPATRLYNTCGRQELPGCKVFEMLLAFRMRLVHAQDMQ